MGHLAKLFRWEEIAHCIRVMCERQELGTRRDRSSNEINVVIGSRMRIHNFELGYRKAVAFRLFLPGHVVAGMVVVEDDDLVVRC